MSYELCENCFKNEWLKRYVVENGKISRCSRCGGSELRTISLQDKKFQSLFKGVFRYYYSEILYNTHWGGVSNWIDLLENENEIFNFRFTYEDTSGIAIKMYNDKAQIEKNNELYDVLSEFEGHISNYDEEVSLYFGEGRMDAFVQPIKDEQWDWLRKLDSFIELYNPYIVAKEICNKIKELVQPLEEKMCDKILYRARIGVKATLVVRRHIVGGANRTLISVKTPLRLSRTGTDRRITAE